MLASHISNLKNWWYLLPLLHRVRADYNRPTISAPKLTSGTGTDTDSHYDTADDEILEACVKTATASSRKTPRDRKRARNRERKSCECAAILDLLCFFSSRQICSGT